MAWLPRRRHNMQQVKYYHTVPAANTTAGGLESQGQPLCPQDSAVGSQAAPWQSAGGHHIAAPTCVRAQAQQQSNLRHPLPKADLGTQSASTALSAPLGHQPASSSVRWADSPADRTLRGAHLSGTRAGSVHEPHCHGPPELKKGGCPKQH
ncbi:hypothetical protein NDU88_004116 [Pleurodeles waltl]|uniref:Uncharacterized protein n=1 Tax=Pleurodeles waltl TaxID=8319 RepID=A0AAV7MSK2_PLEWA|nr:hypothetical protein NDU88_004116 [Pleurodeles waltl]